MKEPWWAERSVSDDVPEDRLEPEQMTEAEYAVTKQSRPSMSLLSSGARPVPNR